MKAHKMVQKIEKADAATVDAVLGASLSRKMLLCPEYEIVYIALSRDNEENWKKTVRAILKLLSTEQRDN